MTEFLTGIGVLAGGAAIGWVGNALLKSRDTSSRLTSHEDLCGQRYAAIERRMDRIDERGDRMEDKLDRLLQRG